MPCPGCCLGAVANSVLGLLCDDSMAFLRSASWRSAGVPCRSPLLSFLYAYDTVMALQHYQTCHCMSDGMSTENDVSDDIAT